MFKNLKKTVNAKLLLAVMVIQASGAITGINVLYAQGGGPTQPEVHSFEPIGTNQMVDLFTGDFTYNIPLFNLPGPDGGYPINLAYHSGIQMEQEATWVGLGWNINVGTINRQVRNLPDDFGGSQEENIKIKTDMRTNWTVGVGGNLSIELFGFDVTSAASGSISVSAAVYYNNFKGIGYTVGAGFDASFGLGESGISGISGDLGFNFSLDSQEGIDAGVTFGVGLDNGNTKKNLSAGTGYNNRTGWKRDLNINTSISATTKSNRLKSRESYPKDPEDPKSLMMVRYNWADNVQSGGGSASISFAGNSASMSVPYQMRGVNARLSFGSGFNAVGTHTKYGVNMFYNMSKLKDKNIEKNFKGVGYLYYQNTTDASHALESDYRVKDVSRENDGLVHKDTRRLGMPSLNYDIYSVTGQGIGSMFRPRRDDIATIVAPRAKSEFNGGSLGIELPLSTPVNFRAGLDVNYNYSHTKTDFWPNSANAAALSFQSTRPSMQNSVYFQNYGEMTVDDLGSNYGSSVASNNPVTYGFKNENGFYDITSTDQYAGGTIDVDNTRSSRKRRAVGIEPFSNEVICNTNSTNQGVSIPEFDISYYTTTSSTGYNQSNLSSFESTRLNLEQTHIGGFIATNAQGMRYIYALPAYNKMEKDVVFSVTETTSILDNPAVDVSVSGGAIDYKKQGTDQFYQSTEKEDYAHSFMLTSILGTDYADIDGVAGPSDGDMGYWVKFNYVRAKSDMKWRSPFEDAMYDRGYRMSFKDGKGRYSYGEKEVWYVATVETKTHVAEFIVSPREDTYQPGHEFDGTSPTVKGYYHLDRIDIYAKAERYPAGQFNSNAEPIKSCHFVYDYSLCTGIPANPGNTDPASNVLANQGGKLTLKKVYFTYRNNLSGKTTPYEFEYNTTVGGSGVTYDQAAVDRWGNYQPNSSGSNIDYPYVSPYTTATQANQRAAVWSMSAINLPSGGRYEVDYESDTYAYVQNEVAMNMFQIASLEAYTSSADDNQISHPKVTDPGNDANPERRNVYFALKNPIPNTWSTAEKAAEMAKYMAVGEYMYFKVYINVTKNEDSKELVAGYAKVTEVGYDATSEVNNEYLWGYVQLDFLHVDGSPTNFHPFTEVGARHIKYNHPDVLYDNPPNANKEELSKSDIKNAGWSLLANITDIKDLFTSFTNVCYDDGRLDYIDLSKSVIRLRTPDKIKYGGGHRVKEIRIIDNWADAFLSGPEPTSTYGVRYEYDMDENGETISSGVASYEPLTGGDEIPLRNPVSGWEKKNILAKSQAQTYTEEPGNESLFPGATVGYRQVRTMSINTAGKLADPQNYLASTGGVTVNKFYTSREYPVIRKNSELQTDKTLRKSRLLIPALIVNYDRSRMAASQGYYIELNNMHGKPLSQLEYGLDDDGLEVILSSVEYEYFDTPKLTTNRAGETFVTRSLNNQVDILYSDIDQSDSTQSDIASGILATEVEFIPETRFNESKQISGGLHMNFETFGILPAFFPIPNFNWRVQKTGTVVTNKVVNKTGIMKKTTAINRGSKSESEHLVFDQYTGQPLLSTITNDYGDKVYSYSILSYDQYEGTGPAYKNSGYQAVGTSPSSLGSGLYQVTFASGSGNSYFEGDELLATPLTAGGIPDNSRDKAVCYYKRQKLLNGVPQNDHIIESAQTLSGSYLYTVIRSGRRNLLSVPISNIIALDNPTINRTKTTCVDGVGDDNQTINILSIDNVLSIDATELGNKWYKDTRQMDELPSYWFDKTLYAKGMAGVYGAIRSSVYVDDRTQTETTGLTDVDLEVDGVMNDVKLFDWDYLLTTSTGCADKWLETSTITLKNASSSSIESKNILGTYSSSLYGKIGTEAIAVAANAKNTEIGSENFEEYSTGSLAITNNATNNLNFYTTIDQTSRKVEDRFEIDFGFNDYGDVNVAYADLIQYTDFVLRIHFDGYYDDQGEEVLIKNGLTITQNGNGTAHIVIQSPADMHVEDYDKRRWRGELFAKKTIPDYPTGLSNTGVSIVEGRAHTGTQCLSVTNTEGSDFLQGRLTLVPGEKYQLSGWFSSANNKALLKNYDDMLYSELVLEFFDISGTLVTSITYNEDEIFRGDFIEDWRKFNVDFTMPSGAHYVSITLPATEQVLDPATQTNVNTAYYDDIRIQPLDGGMQTYVYNKENMRLEAILDANNYATFYYYDDEGNLFLVKRETEKGIITVQESRSYMVKNEWW